MNKIFRHFFNSSRSSTLSYMSYAKYSPVSSAAGGFYSHNENSTIYALASGGYRSSVAVIRVSGPKASEVVKKIGKFNNEPETRKVILRKLYDPKSNILLDKGIILWFKGPNSYTGEDCCEFQIHGGFAVIKAVLRSIGDFKGLRMAEPGEFTRRAFVNGKMDLTEVDGLGDLISSETEMQRIQALQQMSGKLGKLYEKWRNRIAKNLANAECFIDFGEDENIESEIMENVEKDIRSLVKEIKSHLQDQRKGELLRNGIRICIVGEPNVGKSSLLNIICKDEAAIVSEIPGTTRDVIEKTVSIRGYPLIFSDTAGIRNLPKEGDPIEFEGIKRSFEAMKKADLIILILAYNNNKNLVNRIKNKSTKKEFLESEIQHLFNLQAKVENKNSSVNVDVNVDTDERKKFEEKLILVLNKLDLAFSSENSNSRRTENENEMQIQQEQVNESSFFDAQISCKTFLGVEDFSDKIYNRVKEMCTNPQVESPYLTQERYRSHLENCVTSLQEFLNSETNDLALKTNFLRNSINSIGYITGHYGAEEILDIIFRDFCIGK